MSRIEQEPLDLVLSKYNIKVLNIRNESYKDKKGVWWIQTTSGLKILKKISNSEDTLKYILSAVNHLVNKGINIPKANKTIEGPEYAKINGVCYVLLDAIDGTTPSYSSSNDLAAIVKELARFHKASAGFIPKSDTKPKYHLGTWVEDYTQQIEDMNKFYGDEVILKENNPIGNLIVKDFPYFYERAQYAIEGLKGKEYKAWTEKASKTGCLCHQDFAAGNLILDSQGRIFVLDTDSITIDIPARDIRKLLNKIMKKSGKWNADLAKKIISHYQSENPLSQTEWKVVKLDLMFPHLFIGAMNKYYYKRDKEWSNEKYLERIKEMSSFEKTITPVLNSFDSIIS